MNKCNVTKTLLGWLLYRPDTEEFLVGIKADENSVVTLYTKEPILGYLYQSERLAFRASIFIDQIFEVVPLFDYGDKLAVAFNRND